MYCHHIHLLHIFKLTRHFLHTQYFQKQWLLLQTVLVFYALELAFDYSYLRCRVVPLENHHVIEVQLLFAVYFDHAEVAIVEGLDEVVASVESFVRAGGFTAHVY